MHRITGTRRNPAGAAMAGAVLALLVLTGLGLAACGSSGSPPATSASASAPAATGASGVTAPSGSNKQSGSHTPARSHRPPGATSPPSSTRPSESNKPSGSHTPSVQQSPQAAALRACLARYGLNKPTSGQITEALQKCGSLLSGGGHATPAAKERYKKYAACMRENGANLPEPNTSGVGPVFETKGLETNTPQWRAAREKCRSVLRHSH